MEIVKIYLAGGISGIPSDMQNKWRNKIRDEININNDYTRRKPSFISPTDYYSMNLSDFKSERESMEFSLNYVRKSDLVIVNFNVPESIGTAMELMLAKENKIPVIGINAEKHELHPWLELCTTRICSSIREAVDYVVNFYLN